MKFLIAGTGGVGGFFGAKLASKGNDVWFLARGAHLEAMRAEGLHVQSTQGEYHLAERSHMIADPSEAPEADCVLFCVKAYDTEQAARQLLESPSRKSLILSLQNGIDNEEKIGKILPEAEAAGGIAYISSRVDAPGRILETGGFQRIVYGSFSAEPSERLSAVGERLRQADIRADFADDIQLELWKKYIFISAMGGLSALTRLTQGEMLDTEETRMLVFAAMKETEAVGLALGIPLEPLVKEKVFEAMARFDRGTRASMYFDLVNGKPMELEALSGTVLRLGEQVHVPTPIHRVIYASLLPYHRKAATA